MKKTTKIFLIPFFVFIVFLAPSVSLFSDDAVVTNLVTAKDLLQNLSDKFKKSIKDYEADITWTQDTNKQKGTLYFKNPQKIKIVFSDPVGQVICTNGYELWVYIKYLNIVLHQDLMKKTKKKNNEGKMETVVNPILVNPVGLDKFLTGYSIEFIDTKNTVTYKDGNQVYKLKLIRWRSLKNGFNVVYLTIGSSGLIRKVEGVTAAFRHIILEIDNIKTNTGISDLIFDYEPPAHSSTVDNFITKKRE